MSKPTLRPPREVFERLCEHHTAADIARIYGVTDECVRGWAAKYELTPKRARQGQTLGAARVPACEPPAQTYAELLAWNTRAICRAPPPASLRLSYWVQGSA